MKTIEMERENIEKRKTITYLLRSYFMKNNIYNDFYFILFFFFL